MKSIVICVDLNQRSLDTLKTISDKINLQDSLIHLIHVFEIHYTGQGYYAIVYPTTEEYPEIEKSVLKGLAELATDLKLPENRVVKKCVFSHSKESVLKDYLSEVNAGMVIVATRGKHGVDGLFSGSLTNFLCQYSPCDVLVLRPVT